MVKVKVKNNICPRTGHEGPEEECRYSSTLSLASALDGGGWLTSRSGRITPAKGDLVPILQEVGWAKGPVWTSAKSVDCTGIRSLDRPAGNELLYRHSSVR